ncbi:hypothetical protein F5Y18DRAFT_433900 [Xylariaceae sp. FL1019]|nr:hypothetical protein F5Y18DRAFT_433900 [Xylariaceae sp. FL1019]
MAGIDSKPAVHFFRVQHDRSFTLWSDVAGFESRAHYLMDYSYWITPKLNLHLCWENRSSEPTPFISVFDNEADAYSRALFHAKRKDRNVFIAKITVPKLEATFLLIRFQEGTVQLPAWEDRSSGCVFLSTADVRKHLKIPQAISQLSEWFALDEIPGTLTERRSLYLMKWEKMQQTIDQIENDEKPPSIDINPRDWVPATGGPDTEIT